MLLRSMAVIGALLMAVSLAAPGPGQLLRFQCVVVTEDRAAPSWVGWGDGPTMAIALAAAVHAACDPAPEKERSTCRVRAPLGRVTASTRRGPKSRHAHRPISTVYVEIEIYRDKARIEALGRAWGPSTGVSADESPTFRQACRRALEKVCALVGAVPATAQYPLDADRGTLACQGKTWQIVRHEWAGQLSDPEGARFIPDATDPRRPRH